MTMKEKLLVAAILDNNESQDFFGNQNLFGDWLPEEIDEFAGEYYAWLSTLNKKPRSDWDTWGIVDVMHEQTEDGRMLSRVLPQDRSKSEYWGSIHIISDEGLHSFLAHRIRMEME